MRMGEIKVVLNKPGEVKSVLYIEDGTEIEIRSAILADSQTVEWDMGRPVLNVSMPVSYIEVRDDDL